MNDFTKEELKNIRTCCDAAYMSGLCSPSEVNQVRSKIQRLIDNYCDHDFQNTYNEREVWRCAHCGAE
jgi:hypothetical protein